MPLNRSRLFPTLRRRCIGALLLVCLAAVPSLHATVVEEFGFEELVSQSALIFRGEVTGSESHREGDLVYTTVSFSVTEILKGQSDDTLRLRFLGGSAEAYVATVEGQFIPAVGDEGVYFVSSTAQSLVNPLSGWQQGYFPLTSDANGAEYLDMRQRPDFLIPGLEPDPMLQKMRNMGFAAAAIEARFPQALLFSWADFRDAIAAEVAGLTRPGKGEEAAP